MINLIKEKECRLSSQEMFDIISFALQTCESDGFLNSFVFERALYLYAADILLEDRKDEIISLIIESPLNAWNTLIDDGTIDELIKNYPVELELLAENGSRWFEEFGTYAHSARGLLNNIQQFAGDIVSSAAKQLKEAGDGNISDILAIGEKWGIQ